MTKKHYEAIARSIKGTLGSYPESIQAMRMLTVYLASTFEVENPRFDREKFLTACGVEQNCSVTGEPCASWEMPNTKDIKCLDCGRMM